MWVTAMGPIVSIADGKISSVITPESDIKQRKQGNPVGLGSRGGALVVINHKASPNDKETAAQSSYCHMVKIASGIKIGQTVKAGQIIGYVGGGVYGYTEPHPTDGGEKWRCGWPGGGNTTGPHLHFGLKLNINGKIEGVDPLAFEYPESVILSDEKYSKELKNIKKYVDSVKEELVKLHLQGSGATKLKTK
jgi:murein DD-endopeptidase MepM/ murein hydrolase activator NlpD